MGVKDCRPDWDAYFLGIAKAVAARADCTRRKVGAVIVRGNRVISTGYNGAPAGQPGCLTDGACPRGRHYQVEMAGNSEYNEFRMARCACYAPWPCPLYVPKGSNYSSGPGMCIAVHAEANAIAYAGRARCLAGTIYCTDDPCYDCLKLIVAAGISRIVHG